MSQLVKKDFVRYLVTPLAELSSILEVQGKLANWLEHQGLSSDQKGWLICYLPQVGWILMNSFLGVAPELMKSPLKILSWMDHEREEVEIPEFDPTKLDKIAQSNKNDRIFGLELKRTLDQKNQLRLEYRQVWYRPELFKPIYGGGL